MRNLVHVILALALFSSCETIVEVDVPRLPDKLVVNSFFTTHQEWEVSVLKSRYILDNNNDVIYITNATIQLLVDGQASGTFNYDPIYYVYRLSGPKPIPGKRYGVVVNAPGFPEATAEDQIPLAPAIMEVDYDGPAQGDDFIKTYPLKVKFKDAPGKSRYGIQVVKYMFNPRFNEFGEIIGRDTVPNYYSVFSSNPLLERDGSHEYTLYVSEFFQDGAEIELKFQASGYVNQFSDPDFEYEGPLVIQIINMSEASYLYQRNINNYQFNVGNPFSEPVQVFNNIKNGFGIFGGFSRASKELPRFTQGY